MRDCNVPGRGDRQALVNLRGQGGGDAGLVQLEVIENKELSVGREALLPSREGNDLAPPILRGKRELVRQFEGNRCQNERTEEK